MQAYEMTKDGKKASDSLSILMVKFVVSQTILVTLTAVILIFQFDYFSKLVNNFLFLAIAGFVANIIAILFIILLGVNKKFVLSILKPCYILLWKIKVIKDIESSLDKLKLSVDNFSDKFKLIKKQKMIVVKMAIVSAVQYMAYYYITYAVYRAFGNSGVSVFNIIPAQAFLMMIMAFTPMPGASIAAEGGFLLLFSAIFEKGTLNMSLLFWRIYTFYIPIIVGAFFLFRGKNKKSG